VDAFVGNADVGMGIIHVDVIPGRYEDEIRIETLDEPRQDVLVYCQVVPIP